MSCYIVDNGDIDVMVNAAIQYHLTSADPDILGATLLAENIASFRHCYRHYREPVNLDELDARHYVHTPFPLPLHPYAVLKVVDGYTVACDDNPGWESSEAHGLCIGLTVKAESLLPPEDLREVEVGQWGFVTKAYRLTPLFDRMPWDVARVDDACAFRWAA